MSPYQVIKKNAHRAQTKHTKMGGIVINALRKAVRTSLQKITKIIQALEISTTIKIKRKILLLLDLLSK